MLCTAVKEQEVSEFSLLPVPDPAAPLLIHPHFSCDRSSTASLTSQDLALSKKGCFVAPKDVLPQRTPNFACDYSQEGNEVGDNISLLK